MQYIIVIVSDIIVAYPHTFFCGMDKPSPLELNSLKLLRNLESKNFFRLQSKYESKDMHANDHHNSLRPMEQIRISMHSTYPTVAMISSSVGGARNGSTTSALSSRLK